jgi:RNA recognition motif. (a.k.a. RRM, RBD, or RNP domain)
MYGPIKKILMVHDSNEAKPRGYAFIEYEHERDMHCKYHQKALPAECYPPTRRSITKALGNVKFKCFQGFCNADEFRVFQIKW